jgi:amino acid transporter
VVLQIFSFYVFENSIFFFFVDQRFRVCCRFHQFLSSIRYYFVVLLILRGSSVNSMEEDDDVVLKKLGYEKVLHRGLNAFSNFAFGFTEVAVLASFTSYYGYGLQTGGPATIIWGFITVFAMNTVSAYSMAEICAAYPSAGSVYHWSAQLVPAQYAPLASYVCGWFNFLGNAAGDASFAVFFAQFLNSAIGVSGGSVYYDDATDNANNSVGVSCNTSTAPLCLLWYYIIYIILCLILFYRCQLQSC